MNIISKILTVIINPAIQGLLGIAILYFVWGVWVFVKNSDNPEARQNGGRHILYATIGVAVMVSVFGIMSFIQNSFGLLK